MAMKHSVYDSDTHFYINPATRMMQNDGSAKNKVIQYDHNSERFTFEIPRYVEGHDMSLCNVIQVHYDNIDAQTKEESKGVYTVNDMQISEEDENVVILSWLISQNATNFVGSLNFLVRFSCVDPDGTIQYVWNTGVFSGVSVSTGIDNGEAVVEQYADVLEAWKDELKSNLLTDVEQTKHGADNDGVNVWTATFGNGETSDFIVRDGVDGETPVKGTDYWTPEEQSEIENQNIEYIANEVASRCRFRIEFVDSVDKCTDQRAAYVLTPDMYIYTFVGATNFPTITIHEASNATYTKDGELETYTGYSCKYTNMIPVHEGDQFVYTGRSNKQTQQTPAVLLYDADGRFIDTTAFGDIHPGQGGTPMLTVTYTVPSGVSFVVFHSIEKSPYPNYVTLDVVWVVRGSWKNSGIKFTDGVEIPEVEVPTKVSELENDAGYITEDDIPEVEVPTKLSQLEADGIIGQVLSIGASALTILGGSIHISKTDYGFSVDGNRIQYVGDPEEADDAANKGYVDDLVGDIDTALDSIISIQNSLIGGDA